MLILILILLLLIVIFFLLFILILLILVLILVLLLLLLLLQLILCPGKIIFGLYIARIELQRVNISPDAFLILLFLDQRVSKVVEALCLSDRISFTFNC